MLDNLMEIFGEADPLAFIIGYITVLSSIYIFKMSSKSTITKERYEKLIFPMFDIIEPILFKEKDFIVFQRLFDVYENNKYLAGGKLTYVMYLCSIDFSDKNFSSLCQIINSEFDDCCRILGLKTRTIFYRLDHSQYKTKLMLILYMITNLLLLLMGPFLLFAGLYFIKSI